MVDISTYLEMKYPFVGLIPNPPDHSTDNGNLFSATAWRLGIYKASNLISCLNANRNSNETFNRYPGDRSLNSWDDLIGIASIAQGWASGILKAGGFWSYWDNTGTKGFKISCWLGRFPGFVPFLKVASGQCIGPIGVVELALSFLLVLSAKPSDTSGKCLDYLRLKTVIGRYWLVDQAIRIWWWKVRKDNGSMAGVYEIYFGSLHPITQRAKEFEI